MHVACSSMSSILAPSWLVKRAARLHSQSCWMRRLGSCKAAWVCDPPLSAIHLRPHAFGDSIAACQPEACPAASHSRRLSSCHQLVWCNGGGGGLPTLLHPGLSELAGACAAMLDGKASMPNEAALADMLAQVDFLQRKRAMLQCTLPAAPSLQATSVAHPLGLPAQVTHCCGAACGWYANF